MKTNQCNLSQNNEEEKNIEENHTEYEDAVTDNGKGFLKIDKQQSVGTKFTKNRANSKFSSYANSEFGKDEFYSLPPEIDNPLYQQHNIDEEEEDKEESKEKLNNRQNDEESDVFYDARSGSQFEIVQHKIKSNFVANDDLKSNKTNEELKCSNFYTPKTQYEKIGFNRKYPNSNPSINEPSDYHDIDQNLIIEAPKIPKTPSNNHPEFDKILSLEVDAVSTKPVQELKFVNPEKKSTLDYRKLDRIRQAHACLTVGSRKTDKKLSINKILKEQIDEEIENSESSKMHEVQSPESNTLQDEADSSLNVDKCVEELDYGSLACRKKIVTSHPQIITLLLETISFFCPDLEGKPIAIVSHTGIKNGAKAGVGTPEHNSKYLGLGVFLTLTKMNSTCRLIYDREENNLQKEIPETIKHLREMDNSPCIVINTSSNPDISKIINKGCESMNLKRHEGNDRQADMLFIDLCLITSGKKSN